MNGKIITNIVKGILAELGYVAAIVIAAAVLCVLFSLRA
jgi:hypothetical protein